MKGLQPTILMALLVLTTLLTTPTHALLLYTAEHPPLSYSHGGDIKGLAPDIVRELLKRLVLEADIHVTPWARAYHSVRHTPDTAVFVTVRTPERESLFKWVGPIMQSTNSFYALKHTDIVVQNQQDLAALKNIAVPRDWFAYQELQAKGLDNLLGVTEPVQMFALLRRGRVPLILADDLSFYAKGEAAVAAGRMGSKDVKVVYPYRRAYGYIGFWKDTDDQEIQRWQATLDEMKRDGSFSRIYQHWLPGKEEPGLLEPISAP